MSMIGIGLGSANVRVASVTDDTPEILNIDDGQKMPPVLAFGKQREGRNGVIVGSQAVPYSETDPAHTVSQFIHHLGDDYSYQFPSEERDYQPEMLTGLLIKKAVQEAEKRVQDINEVNRAVITIPAAWTNANERACIEAAACFAHLDNAELLPEPSAACVAYDIGKEAEDIETVAVYDLGGGTFDISIVNIVPDKEKGNQYVVDTNAGKQKLGGEDFDEILQEYIAEQFEERTGIDLTDDEKQMERIRQEAKSTKEKLSSAESAKITVPYVAEGENVEQDITREEFEDLTGHLVDDTIDLCQELLDDEGYNPEDIDTVLLVGGSTKMPQVENAVKEFFGQEPAKQDNPGQTIALGAAEHAKEMIKFAKNDPNKELEWEYIQNTFDELGKLQSSPKILKLPVEPFIGFELADGSLEAIIEPGDNFPCEVQTKYRTVKEHQTKVTISLYKSYEYHERGWRATPEQCNHMGNITISGIEPVPCSHIIYIKFELGIDSCLRIEAWMGGNKESELEVTPECIRIDGKSEESKQTYSPPSYEEIQRIRDELPTVV